MEGLDWNKEDPKGWYMSEKLDGIRAYWDGKQLWSKRGNLINVPESFTFGFPNYHLDCELWGGYENVERNGALLKLSCIKGKISPIDWNEFKLFVFDAPQEKGNYYQRYLFLEKHLPLDCTSNYLSLIPIIKCLGVGHLRTYLEEITQKGGEGIMIYHPDTPYEIGRTPNLLKVKKYFISTVRFLRIHLKSYSFVCQQDNGVICFVKCGTRDFYLDPPVIGSEISVRHLGYFPKSQKYKYPVVNQQKGNIRPLELT